MLSYLASLVLLGFSFQFVLGLVAILPAVLSAALSRYTSPKATCASHAITQTILGIIYGAYVACITALFVRTRHVATTWPYVLVGIVWVFVALASNANDKARERGYLGLMQTDEEEATTTGAMIGTYAGALGFLLFFKMPWLAFSVPAVGWLITWSFRFGAWLGHFWLVQAVLFLVVLGFFINVGMTALIGIPMVLYAAWSAIRGDSHGKQAAAVAVRGQGSLEGGAKQLELLESDLGNESAEFEDET